MSLINYNNVDVYQGESLILKDVNFHVDEGEFIYIIGKVGSGKSSLLKTFYCELDVYDDKEEQQAEVLDRNLITLKRREIPALRKEMGIIFQDFKLLNDRTVRKNLEFVLRSTGWKDKKEICERIESVLKDVGMLDKIDKLPHELSGGEQQRVAIARSLVNNPDIILADEPTANLDEKLSLEFIANLEELKKLNKTIIMATHDSLFFDHRLVDKIIEIKNGKIITNDDK